MSILRFARRSRRHNALLYSEDFSNAAWTANTATITAAAADTPHGGPNGTKLKENSGSAQHFYYQTLAAPVGKVTASVYAKAAERSFLWINIRESGTSRIGWFDLTNGIVGSVSGGPTVFMIDAGNGWYRCSVTITITTLSNIQIGVSAADATQTDTGDGTAGILLWGAQLVLRPNAGGYQRTSSAAR
jgi:hypothetical protein